MLYGLLGLDFWLPSAELARLPLQLPARVESLPRCETSERWVGFLDQAGTWWGNGEAEDSGDTSKTSPLWNARIVALFPTVNSDAPGSKGMLCTTSRSSGLHCKVVPASIP
mmetsp:Transcript_53793/g.114847  ORF Transcript_53793/g.114847 Transcript_53793/m.114847 type:complete len:111 (-) Transcript_53793:1044-1376(-)